MTSSAKSVRNFLEARDRRQDSLAQQLGPGYPATIFLSLNIPGENKTPPAAVALYGWALAQLGAAFPALQTLETASDLLGPYAILALDCPPSEAKNRCIAIENHHPSARLVDLDVYGADGVQYDRARLGLSARACLVCSLPAVDCMRTKRHAAADIMAKVDELLARFRA